MPTTRRCTDSVVRPRSQRSQRTSLIVLKQPRPGCDQTGFNQIQTRQLSSCGHPATTSTANVIAADRRLLHHSCPVCSRPRHLRRLPLVDADACSTYRVAMLCCVTSAASDPSFCTIGHTSDACGRTGTLLTGLWERRAGRPYGSPDRSTSVGFECGGPTDLPPEDPRPITDALISLHWLRAPERIQYKLAILAYRVLHGDTPRYLGPLIRVDDLPGRRPLRSSYTNRLVIPQVKLSAVEHLWLRLRTSETCLTNSRS